MHFLAFLSSMSSDMLNPSTYHVMFHLSDGAVLGQQRWSSDGQIALRRRNLETALQRAAGTENSPICREEFSSYFRFVVDLACTMTCPGDV